MSVFKRIIPSGKTTWGYQFVNKYKDALPHEPKKPCCFIFTTKKEAASAEAAEKLRLEREHERATNPAAPSNVLTVGALIDRFIEHQISHANIEKKTADRYREYVPYLAPAILAIRDYSSASTPLFTLEWDRLLASGGHYRYNQFRPVPKSRPLKWRTVKNIRGLVVAALNHAEARGLIPHNPARLSKCDRPASEKGRKPEVLSAEQQRLLYDSAQASGAICGQMADYILFDASIGARRGEALAVRFDDVTGDTLHIWQSLSQTKEGGVEFKRPKTPTSRREVRLEPATLGVIARQQVLQARLRTAHGPDYQDHGLIFAQPDGSPFRPNSVSSAISALCRRLKMPKGVSLHTLRHSYASHRIASGDSIPEVSRDLGHSNPATTMGIYAHAIPGSRKPTGWTDYQKRHGGIGAEEEKPQ